MAQTLPVNQGARRCIYTLSICGTLSPNLPHYGMARKCWLHLFNRCTTAAFRCARFWWDKVLNSEHYDVISWLFLRVLALIYMAAFASMALQIEGLVGSGGILPIAGKLSAIHESSGMRAYWIYPTIFWLNASDQVLIGSCIVGIFAGLLVLFNLFTRIALITCYVLYLSIVSAGQDFTNFQWDMFLLEAGFLAIFLLNGSRIIVFLYRWLLFRFMFLGGLVKVASGDPTWANLTALTYHYETQPLPSPLAWYIHQLPMWVHELSVISVFLIELVIPFFIFLPRRFRMFAAWSFIVLQAGIIATGNYNFFNLLTISLCLFLFDDQSIAWIVGKKSAYRIRAAALKPGRAATLTAATLASIILLSNATLAWTAVTQKPPPQPFKGLMRTTLVFGIANAYGPFAVMTTLRGEIEIEGSLNGRDWFPYEFRYKPGNLEKESCWLIPHQPRLDWQMWFAALRPDQPPFWFFRLIKGLEQARPAVISLFQKVPFEGRRPLYLRAKFYRYRYSNPYLRESTGQIWSREYLGLYWPPR